MRCTQAEHASDISGKIYSEQTQMFHYLLVKWIAQLTGRRPKRSWFINQ